MPEMKTYTFDCHVFAVAELTAKSEKAGEKIVREKLSGAEFSMGKWPDGTKARATFGLERDDEVDADWNEEDDTFTYDCGGFVKLEVKAPTRKKGEKLVREKLDGASFRLGKWPDGKPARISLSVDDEIDLIEINGEYV